jgi:hypothetical protein
VKEFFFLLFHFCYSCSKNNISRKCFHCRIFPITIRALSRLDMLRRSILYSKYYAFMHNLNRPIFVSSISDAVWSQQDSKASRAENLLRLAAIDCDELAVELNVLEGKLQFKSFFSTDNLN